MSKTNNYSEEDFDFKKIQKNDNKRNRKNNRHKNRQNLNDIIEKINNGYDLTSIEDELENDNNG